MEPKEILKSLSNDLKKAVNHTLQEFSSLHTGKATPAMLDGVPIESELIVRVDHGSTMGQERRSRH